MTASLLAGPELDALVAEKVCGWSVYQATNGYGESGWWVASYPQAAGVQVPAYSTNIVAAMSLVDELRQRFHCAITIDTRGRGLSGSVWLVTFWDDFQGKYTMKGKEAVPSESASLPHAIALAALRIAGL